MKAEIEAQSVEYELLLRLRQHLWRVACPSLYSQASRRTKRNKKQRDELEMRNVCHLLDAQLHEFLCNQHQSLADLEFSDDEASGESVHIILTKLLPQLCLFLDQYANRELCRERKSQSIAYPWLQSIIQHIENNYASDSYFCFFSAAQQDDYRKITRLFNVDSESFHADKVELLIHINIEISKLKAIPPARPASTQPQQSSTATMDNPCTRFMCQATAVLHAVFSGFSGCTQCPHAHGILLDLPQSEAEMNSEIGLFIYNSSGCEDHQWQEATVRVITEDGDLTSSLAFQNNTELDKQPCRTLCSAVKNASRFQRGLILHTRHDGNPESYDKCTIVVPPGPAPARQKTRPLAGPESRSSLWKMMYSNRFRSHRDLLGKEFVTASERRVLAAKLMLGMLVSMAKYHTIPVWDSKQIYIVHEENVFMNVSCAVVQDTTVTAPTTAHTMSGDKAQQAKSYDEAKEDNQPDDPVISVPLMALAKVLLEICVGLPRADIEIDPSSDNLSKWSEISDLIDSALRNPAYFELSPIFEAARSCLDFHEIVHEQCSQARLSAIPPDLTKLETKTFVTHVLERFLRTENDIRMASDMSRLVIQKTKSIVSLFDDSEHLGEDTAESQYAKRFLEDLTMFRTSTERFSSTQHQLPVKVAIIDTGYDRQTPTLRSIQEAHCQSWIGARDNIKDLHGHGTYCAYFLHSVAPRAQIHIARTFSGEEISLEEARNISKAIRFAVDEWKVDIISMSFGLQKPQTVAEDEWNKMVQSIRAAVEHATEHHVLIFSATSNRGINEPRAFPATMKDCIIGIHASDGNGNDGKINPDSYRSDENFTTLGIALKAPRFRAPGWVYKSGTSFATPVAAGIAAVMLETGQKLDLMTDITRRGLKTVAGMKEMFWLMSKPERTKGDYRHVAPWLLWNEHWQTDDEKRKRVRQQITQAFEDLSTRVAFPLD